MRFSNSTGKLNPNLLCAPFRKVEDYEKDVPSINEIERKYTHHKSSSLSLKKRPSRKLIEIPQLADDFNNLSLEKQVEAMMRPITGPGEKAENLLRLLEDEEHSKSKFSSKETEKLTLETEDFESSHRVNGRNILQELKYQPSSVKISKSAKESISLPPLKDNDQLFTTQTAKHWHYHQPIKHTPRNVRANLTPADVSNSMQKNTNIVMETKLSLDKTKIFFSQSKNRLKTKNLVVLTSEASVQRNIDLQNTSTSRFNRSKEISLTTRRKLTPNENLFPNVTPNHQAIKLLNQLENHELFSMANVISPPAHVGEVSTQVNRIINDSPRNQNTNHVSERRYNQISIEDLKPENNDKPSDRRDSEVEVLGLNSSKIDMSKINLLTRGQKAMSSTIVNRKTSQTPLKKKEYYNRWFMPVKYWNASKDMAPPGKKYEELKKDTNYFYHNLHNYASQQSPNIIMKNKKKTELQLNFESLQDKLKQNMVMKKYKKQLAENGERIPIFLKNVEEDIGAAK